MKDAAAQLIALRHYKTLWFGQTWGTALAALWQAEYDAVSAGTFKSLQIIARSFDGESSTSRENFEQAIRLGALMAYRAEKDAAYAAEVFGEPTGTASGPTVTYPVFAPGAFAH